MPSVLCTERPLPALPAQTSMNASPVLQAGRFLAGSKSTNNIELLHKTLAGLKDLDLTGKVSYNTDSPYLSGGAYGDVRIGTCAITGRTEVKVAVKCLRLYLQDKPEVVKLIEREIRVWSRLSHRNVLPLMGYTVEQHGLPALISEFMENGTVLKYVQTHPDCDVAHMILGLAEGLSYLHNEKVIHSDIKSVRMELLSDGKDNVLVSRLGEPLICDFGISRLITVSHTIAGSGIQAQSSTVRGSARWMSPELLLPSGDHVVHSKESDIWALGMTIYEILTKRRPCHQLVCDPQVISSIICGGLPLKPRTSRSWPQEYNELWNICKACWLTDPEARPSAAGIFSILTGLRNTPDEQVVNRTNVHTEARELPKRKKTYDTFADMGIHARRLESGNKACIIM